MGETTHQVVGETTQGRRAKRLTQWRAKRLGGETTQGETTQGERESGRNDPLPLLLPENNKVGMLHVIYECQSVLKRSILPKKNSKKRRYIKCFLEHTMFSCQSLESHETVFRFQQKR